MALSSINLVVSAKVYSALQRQHRHLPPTKRKYWLTFHVRRLELQRQVCGLFTRWLEPCGPQGYHPDSPCKWAITPLWIAFHTSLDLYRDQACCTMLSTCSKITCIFNEMKTFTWTLFECFSPPSSLPCTVLLQNYVLSGKIHSNSLVIFHGNSDSVAS